ncbi:hypothetical protein [Psychroserpens jangbogonensis]|uniref:hypothetical protein n=1 Tax=Psychroserpens jangbogonensis TaxID=1484460 RepID=UPI00053DF053|nr:hypothetical protein [Psychroserpens jangbogonensis]
MKKNILLIATALFLFAGNQSVTAQAKMKKEVQSISVDKTKTEVSAKKKTASLIRPLGLNEKQQEQVYALFAKAGEKMSRVGADSGAKIQGDKQAKMDKYVMAKMKEILTEKQFLKYLDLAKDL